MEAGFPAITRAEVAGRGKQRGLKMGGRGLRPAPQGHADDRYLRVRKRLCDPGHHGKRRSGEAGSFGDGKIFVSDVDEVYTISSGSRTL